MKKSRGDFSANRRLILISGAASLIGIVCSYVALLLLKLIALFTNLFYYHEFSLTSRSPTNQTWGFASVFVPVVGGLVIGFMARYGSEKIRGHGIPEALEAILFGKSRMHPKVAILKPLSSAISIGSGGPFGAEGPIIMTGGAIASIFAQTLHLTASERKTLLVAGAAAGMTAVFASPIAAVLLAVELLLFEWRPRSLVPVAVACMVAIGIRPHLMGVGPLFPVAAHESVGWKGLLLAAMVGGIGGLFSAAISKILYWLEDLFHQLPIHWMWWPALGGMAVGIGGFFEPRALGVGYDVIAGMLRGEFSAYSVLPLVAIKGVVWVIALSSGTSGGVLAPLLIMGAGLGVIEAHWLPAEWISMWPLVSMAAVLGGMMRSPLTAIFFAFELTQDVQSLPPLLVASVVAYATTVLIMKRSILTEKVARRGYDLFREYGVDPLERMRVREVMAEAPVTISGSTLLAEVSGQYFSGTQKHRGYPVVNDEGCLLGVLTSSDVLNAEIHDTLISVGDFIQDRACVTVEPEESCREAAERMASTGVGRLPVVAPGSGNRVIGIITRSDLLKPRNRDFEEEQRQESFIRLYR